MKISASRPDVGQILSCNKWSSTPLDMTRDGIAEFELKTKDHNSEPIIYVHVETFTGRILRIGKSESGVYQRWVKARDGHFSTFEWAMNWSKRYCAKALCFPHYVLFFRSLSDMQTTIWTLPCDLSSLRPIEKTLISEMGPIWEQFLRICTKCGVRDAGHSFNDAISRLDFSDSSLPNLSRMNSKKTWPLK